MDESEFHSYDPKPIGGRVLNNSECFWHLGHSKR